jgi:hypothetical protein
MVFRTAGAVATLLIGLNDQVVAQYYPPLRAIRASRFLLRSPPRTCRRSMRRL